jgi:DUF1680 family protein
MRSRTDKFYILPPGSVRFPADSIFDKKLRLVESGLLKTLDFRALSGFYREKRNQFAAGEFWGKIMRASAVIYGYTRDGWLLDKMRAAVDDIIAIQGPDGEISTAPRSEQPNGSSGADLWERKYVMLGLLGYHDVVKASDFSWAEAECERVKKALFALLDYTISQVGEGEGRRDILSTGWAFCGIESSSILEPVVRTYGLSGDPRHLQFAEYIVRRGGCGRENMFEAIRSGKSPYLIGNNGNPKESIAKAYEMMSCFEGLVEFYRVTKREEDRKAALELYKKLVAEEITYLGSGGADGPFNLGPGTGEQWNLTAQEQANPGLDLMMETCVTVTWMKYCLQLLRLEGDSGTADNIELSAYNALIAALRPDGMFFEYFPRFNGVRNPRVNFSYNVGGFDLSCCTANGPMGLGLIPSAAFMQSDRGPVVNFFTDAFVRCGKMTLDVRSSFPEEGKISVTVGGGAFFSADILFRIPWYARNFTVYRDGEKAGYDIDGNYPGYALVRGPFGQDMTVDVEFEIVDRVEISGPSVDLAGTGLVLLRHGPVALSRDSRYTDTDAPVPFDGDPEPKLASSRVPGAALFSCEYGGHTWIDYASAGGTWDGSSRFVTWNRPERPDTD